MRYYLTPEPDPQSNEKIGDINGLYHTAQERAARGEAVMSTDEMTGIQALERKYPDLPMRPGQVLRCEFEYKRHGTLSLIANFDVASGQIGQVSVGPTRNEKDFAAHIRRTVESSPTTIQWHFISDNLNTHTDGSGIFMADLGNEMNGLKEKSRWYRAAPADQGF
jgi:DDE superfamily endonuclease